jgi:hypothetical protein
MAQHSEAALLCLSNISFSSKSAELVEMTSSRRSISISDLGNPLVYSAERWPAHSSKALDGRINGDGSVLETTKRFILGTAFKFWSELVMRTGISEMTDWRLELVKDGQAKPSFVICLFSLVELLEFTEI